MNRLSPRAGNMRGHVKSALRTEDVTAVTTSQDSKTLSAADREQCHFGLSSQILLA
jgi:hypothetical protein